MLLAAFPSARIVATDYDGAQVALASRRVADPRLEVRQADATALPFPDEAFDLVVEFNTFHHVAGWTSALGECGRVLRPGGTFAAMDETRALFNPLFLAFDRPESLFTKEEYLAAAGRAGLTLEKDVGMRRIIRAVFAKK
uniref:Methyltransferase domain protein n=1 Tax=uncultured bacterium pA1 TaxID=1776268 RepID=A0A0U3U6A5_9BACT|nr:methyltransferase domain protein [uncultured bacterium pA1]